MSKAQKSLLGGMTVLGISGILCKLIGVLFSIPLTHLIGTGGLGLFQSVFPTYSLLLTVSSAGLPVAVSRMVSHSLTLGDPKSARTIFRVALYLLAAIGCILSIAMLMSTGLLAARVSQPESRIGFRNIAPCVAIVCIMSAIRGFMQGQQDMVPTAVSQLIEQVAKVCISLPLAWLGMKTDIVHGAAGALLGITFAEALALLYMIFVWHRRRGEFNALPQTGTGPSLSARSAASTLIRISIPITISACIVPLATFIDSAMLVERMMSAGIALEDARRFYGIQTGLVVRLINIPTALALSISMSLVPAVTAAVASGDKAATVSQSDTGMRFAFLIGLPCSIGMSLLSYGIMRFVYGSSLTGEELVLAGELLSMSSLTVVLFTVVQATTAILQGVRRQWIPMITLVAGVAVKIALNYLLVGRPGLHIHGAPIASLACYTVSMVPNILYAMKYTGMPFNWKGWLLKPGLAAACMGLVVWGLRSLLPVNALTVLAEVAAGAAVYLLAAVKLGAITKEELSRLTRRFTRRKKEAA